MSRWRRATQYATSHPTLWFSTSRTASYTGRESKRQQNLDRLLLHSLTSVMSNALVTACQRPTRVYVIGYIIVMGCQCWRHVVARVAGPANMNVTTIVEAGMSCRQERSLQPRLVIAMGRG